MSALESNFESLVDGLVPLRDLSAQSKAQVLTKAEILRYAPGEFVFEQGERDPYCFYLFEGRLELISDGDTIKRLSGGSSDAVHALAQLQPRKMSARAESEAAVLRLNRDLLDKLAAADRSDDYCDVQVSDIETDDGGDWMTRMLQSNLFSQLPASNIHRIFSSLETVEVKQGEIVVNQGEPGDYYYVITHGRCEVTRSAGADAPGYRLALIGAGDAFGEEALVAGSTRNASVRMLTDGQLVRLPKEGFRELIQSPLLSSVSLEEGKNIAATKSAVWLDVRFPEEFQMNALAGAINRPLNTLRMHSGRLDANCTYIVYCDTGTRSSVAAFLLAERGFDVHCLDGGMMACDEFSAEDASDSDAGELDMTLSEDDTAVVATDGPTLAPVPTSHLSDSERGNDASIKAAALGVELELNDMRIADAAARGEVEDEDALSRQQADAEAEATRRAEEEERLKAEREAADKARAEAVKAAADEARQEAEAKAAAQIEAERERIAAEFERARQDAERLAEAKFLEEKQRLEAEAEKSRLELVEAQRLKAEIEREKAANEEAARKEREAQREKVARVRAEMERKLKDEERKLKESYAWQGEELNRLKEQKKEAEVRLLDEQERVKAQAEESSARLAEARDYQKRLEDVQLTSAREAEIREQQQLALEGKLREELKEKAQSERQKLEDELTRNAAELERAKQERDAAEAAGVAAAEEADRIVADFKDAHARKRAEEEADMRVERERLQADAEHLRLALELAQREQQTALDAQEQIEQEITALKDLKSDDPAAFETDLAELEAQARDAADHVAEIERTRVETQAAALASAGDLAAHKVHEEHIRDDLKDELNDWLKEQDEIENDDVQQGILANQKAHMDRIRKRAQSARMAAKTHDQDLINELAGRLRLREQGPGKTE